MNKRFLALGIIIPLAISGCSSSSKSSESEAYTINLNTSEYVSLCDYSEIVVDVELPEVSDEDVMADIEDTLSLYGSYQDADHTTVQEGDTVNIDFSGILADGTEIENGGATDYDLEIGSGTFIDGFEDSLIGYEVGDTVELYLTFPDEYTEDLAGEDAIFEVTINSIQVYAEQDYTDEWVESLGIDGVATTDEYEAYIYDELYEDAYDDYQSDLEEAAADYVMANSEMLQDAPDEMIDRSYNDMVDYYTSYATYYGMEYYDFMMQYFGAESEEEIDENVMSDAVEYSNGLIILQAVADAEDLNPSDDDVENYLQAYLEYYGYDDEDEFLEYFTWDELREELMCSIVYEFLGTCAVSAE